MSFTLDFTDARIKIATRLLVLCLFVLAYSESIEMLVVLWSGTETAAYSHGFLTLVCALYLIFLQKDYFLNIDLAPNYWALLPLGALSLLWFAAKVVDVQTIQTAVLPAIILFTVAASLGTKAFKLTLIPISLLFFSLPIWSPLLPYLVRVTTRVTHLGLQIVGRPVFVEGNFIHLPGGSFVVERSCAGLQFLLVTTILSLMFASMQNLNLRKGALLFAIGTLLALFANWVRVLAVVLIGDYTQMQHSLVNDHANFGWIIYLFLVLIPFFLISKYFVAESVGLTEGNAATRQNSADKSSVSALVLYVVSCAVLIVGPAMNSVFTYRLNSAESRSIQLPQLSPPWQITGEETASNADDWQPIYQGETETLSQKYSSGDEVVELHIVYYERQQQGAELINTRNLLTDDIVWSQAPGSGGMVRLAPDITVADSAIALDIRSRRQGSKRIWYWYNIGGETASNQYMAKLLQLFALLKNRADAALYAISIDCDASCEKDATLESFMQAISIASEARQ